MLRPLLCAVLFAACASSPETTTPAPLPALPAGAALGEPIEVQASVAFAAVHANPPAYFDKTVLVEATATAVCQRAGCWLQIEDAGDTAMVRWESGCGGKYTFPEDLAGRRVLIQGSFYPKVISAEDVEHLQEEAGEDVAIERDGYEFNATAVLVLAAE